MAGELADRLVSSARELERLATGLTQLAVRVRGAGEGLGGPAARACADWACALDPDAVETAELAVGARRTAQALETYSALPAEVRERVEVGVPALGPGESQLAWILRILAALIDGGGDPARPWRGSDPSVWSPWSLPVRAGTGTRLAGTDGDRAGTDQGIRVSQLPDGD